MSEVYLNLNSMQRRHTSQKTIPKQGKVIETGNLKDNFNQVKNSSVSKNTSNFESKGKKSSEIRYELVKRFQKELNKGFYKVQTDAIAEKMVQKIRDDKDLKFI